MSSPQNELHSSTSLYLQQHATNPVHWKMWSQEILDRAQQEDKLIIVSIGYSSCHWCHVMEHESFENQEVADLMNAHFIAIKVDREERPDLDARFMNAVQLMTGQGGWPLNCIALPDGTPVWGGTYFSKEDWISALDQIAALWESDPEKVKEYGQNMREGLMQIVQESSASKANTFIPSDLEDVLVPWMRNWDMNLGGNKQAPKFPMPSNYQYLLDYALLEGDTAALRFTYTTMNKMATGGLYDFVHGGFTRYSTDRFWKVPHFEKMLYDNAQLLTLYARAYRASQNPLYAETVKRTIHWLENQMKLENGMYASALDADSPTPENEREEGGYYTWTEAELDALQLPDYSLFKAYFDIDTYTAWEGKYILHRPKTDAEFAAEHKIAPDVLNELVAQWHATLNAASESRLATHPAPVRDPKAITAWNALLVQGLGEAHLSLPQMGYDTLTLDLINVLIELSTKNDQVLHLGGADQSPQGFLDDYAALGNAYLTAYKISGDEEYLSHAKAMAQTIDQRFPMSNGGPYRVYDSTEKEAWKQHVEIEDNVIPSANAMLAEFYTQIYDHLSQEEAKEQYQAMIGGIHDRVFRYGPSYSHWLQLALRQTHPHREMVVCGPEAKTQLEQLCAMHYQPNSTTAFTTKASTLPLLEHRYAEDHTRFYLCEGRACQLPTESIDEALALWKK